MSRGRKESDGMVAEIRIRSRKTGRTGSGENESETKDLEDIREIMKS